MGRKSEKIPKKQKVEDAEKEVPDHQSEDDEQPKSEDINKNEKTLKKKSRSASPAEESNGNEAEDEGSNDEEKSTTSSEHQVDESEESPNDKSSPEEAPSKRKRGKNKRSPQKKRKVLKDEGSVSEDNGSQNGDVSEEYEVAKIVAEREIKGQLEYKVRWKGYNAKHDSWEKESHLNCPDILKKYRASKKQAKTSSASENGEWEISKIIDMQTSEKGEKTFRVRWKGFSANDDTWEPEENLKDKPIYKDFIAKFNKGKEIKRELRTKRQSDKKLSTPPQKKRRGKGRK